MSQMKSVFLLLLVSCGADLGLDQGPHSVDWTERRRQMNVRVLDGSNAELEVSPEALSAEVQNHCRVDSLAGMADCETFVWGNGPVAPGVPYSGSSCRQSACMASLKLCTANLLLEIATAANDTVVQGSTGLLTVPPQSRPTRTGLAEYAALVSTEAVVTAGDGLRAAATTALDGSVCLANSLSDELFENESGEKILEGEVLVGALVEAMEASGAAGELAFEGNVAAADRVLAEETSERRGQQVAFMGPVLSRYHAAALLVGGPTARSISDPGPSASR